MQKVRCILLLLSIAATGCSVAKRTAGGESGKGIDSPSSVSIADVIGNNLTNNNFYIQRADVSLEQQAVSVRFLASVKFRKPDSMVINVRTRTGIEAGRGLITDDTLIINDRINRRIYTGSSKAVEKKYGINSSLIWLVFGDIIVGKGDLESGLRCRNGVLSKEYRINERDVQYTIECSRKKVGRIYLEGDVSTGNINILLSDFKEQGRIKFPGRIDISDDNETFDLKIEIRKIESPWNERLGFISNKGYKVVRIK